MVLGRFIIETKEKPKGDSSMNYNEETEQWLCQTSTAHKEK
jgi:hypothetical protein